MEGASDRPEAARDPSEVGRSDAPAVDITPSSPPSAAAVMDGGAASAPPTSSHRAGSLASTISAQRRERAANREAQRNSVPKADEEGAPAADPTAPATAGTNAPDPSVVVGTQHKKKSQAVLDFEAAQRRVRDLAAASSDGAPSAATPSAPVDTTSVGGASGSVRAADPPSSAGAGITVASAARSQNAPTAFAGAANRPAIASARSPSGGSGRGGGDGGQRRVNSRWEPQSPPTMSLAEAAQAFRTLINEANVVNVELAAKAEAAEAAAAAAAAEKAARLMDSADGGGGGGGGSGGVGGSGAQRRSRMMETGIALAKGVRRRIGGAAAGSASSGVHPSKSCLICLDALGTEGGIQALGCMDTFCRLCIATHIEARAAQGHVVSCPICQRGIPQEERDECGPGRPTVVQTPSDAGSHADSSNDGPRSSSGQRTSMRGMITGIAAAALHAPALLRAGPTALAAAAHRLSQVDRQIRSDEAYARRVAASQDADNYDDDDDDLGDEEDFVVLTNGDRVPLSALGATPS
jgi:hypothetical protein